MHLTAALLSSVVRGVGAEITTARKAKGWQRIGLRTAIAAYLAVGQQRQRGDDVADEADDESTPSLQALQTWELGTRKMSLARFVQVCSVLEVDPSDLLGRALARVVPADEDIAIDRNKLARSAMTELAPLKRWLETRDSHRCGDDGSPAPDVVVLPPNSLAALAELAGCPQHQLARVLHAVAADRS